MDGSNVTIMLDGTVLTSTSGEYGGEGHMLQQYTQPPLLEGAGGPLRTGTGVWMIDPETGRPLPPKDHRRDGGSATSDLSRFRPAPDQEQDVEGLVSRE